MEKQTIFIDFLEKEYSVYKEHKDGFDRNHLYFTKEELDKLLADLVEESYEIHYETRHKRYVVVQEFGEYVDHFYEEEIIFNGETITAYDIGATHWGYSVV